MKNLSLIIFSTLIMSCGGSKNISNGETLFTMPCSGSEFSENTNKFFRANSFGESSDHIIAKKKASSNAKSDLASRINVTINSVTDNYLKASELNNVEQTEERFEALSREIVNQSLSGINVICEQSAMTEEGKYKFYIAIELSAQKLITKLNERLSKDDMLKVDYDYEKFKETFEEEMSKLTN